MVEVRLILDTQYNVGYFHKTVNLILLEDDNDNDSKADRYIK